MAFQGDASPAPRCVKPDEAGADEPLNIEVGKPVGNLHGRLALATDELEHVTIFVGHQLEATPARGRSFAPGTTQVRTRRAKPVPPAHLTRSTMRIPHSRAPLEGPYGIQTALQIGTFPPRVSQRCLTA